MGELSQVRFCGTTWPSWIAWVKSNELIGLMSPDSLTELNGWIKFGWQSLLGSIGLHYCGEVWLSWIELFALVGWNESW